MKIKYKQLRFIGVTAILVLCSCAEQLDFAEDNATSSQVSLATPYINGRATTESAPKGSYLFGWPSTQGKTILSPINIGANGNIDNGGKINVYWENIKTPATLTLSNSGDFSKDDKKEDVIDILWGQLSDKKTNNTLEFTLDHKMAQAIIDLTVPVGWTVTSIQLTQLNKQYTFSNSTGNVIAVGKNENSIEIDPASPTVMLPPQEKGKESKLVVKITDDLGKERSFSHKLPYSMAQEPNPGSGQWEDIVLKFRAGYILTISATITSNSNGEIHFTYATLTDWNGKDGGTSSARPAGLYTVTDWNEFATIYNNKSSEYKAVRDIRLCKYGSYDNSNSKWIFTVQRDIDMTDKTVTSLDINGSSDVLKAKDSYRIKGKNATDLGVTDHLDGTVFK